MPAPAQYTGIGSMSGTSLDGLDLACCTYTRAEDGRWSAHIDAAETIAYPADWQDRLAGAMTASAEAYAKLAVDYAHYSGMAVRGFVIQHGLRPQFVAAHGHTVFHQPRSAHFTAQILDGETLATWLDVPLVCNFRNRDVALGGEGAPLAPGALQQLFSGSMFLNLGGIANVALLPQPGWQPVSWRRSSSFLGYDVCACNLLLNHLAGQLTPPLPYDAGGDIARGGIPNQPLLDALAPLEYWHQPPPKSLGREWVDQALLPIFDSAACSTEDKLATACLHIARQLAADLARQQLPPGVLLTTGGGAHNAWLMECLTRELAPLGIVPTVPGRLLVDYMEACLFGFLGLQRLLGLPNVPREVTGAKRSHSAGSIHLPDSWGPLL